MTPKTPTMPTYYGYGAPKAASLPPAQHRRGVWTSQIPKLWPPIQNMATSRDVFPGFLFFICQLVQFDHQIMKYRVTGYPIGLTDQVTVTGIAKGAIILRDWRMGQLARDPSGIQ